MHMGYLIFFVWTIQCTGYRLAMQRTSSVSWSFLASPCEAGNISEEILTLWNKFLWSSNKILKDSLHDIYFCEGFLMSFASWLHFFQKLWNLTVCHLPRLVHPLPSSKHFPLKKFHARAHTQSVHFLRMILIGSALRICKYTWRGWLWLAWKRGILVCVYT